MTVTRIDEFRAHPGMDDELRDLIQSNVPKILAAKGCPSCQVLQNIDDSTRILLIDTWDDAERHRAMVEDLTSMKNVPSGLMEKGLELMSTPPKGAYYRSYVR